MRERTVEEQVAELENLIEALPIGYVSKKTINNKVYYYHQWTEDGKKKSRYLQPDEAELLKAQIENRKALQKELKALSGRSRKARPAQKPLSFETNIRTGKPLAAMAKQVGGLQKRDMFGQITRYLYGEDHTRVCAVYGLRRTGKTTMLLQAIHDMSEEDFTKTAYVKMRTTDVMKNLIRDLDTLFHEGFKYVFVDEVTLVEDFIDSAALLSDLYVPMGMRIVLSGTDSLGFWFAEKNELYDRVRMVHTTFIPYREYSRLLGINSIDEYIRYGGTLRMGEVDFDDEDLNAEDASFRDDESTRRYIDTAICRNIQHSLAHFENGNYFRHLHELYDNNELTSAINRIIEDMNHRFVLKVLTRDFVSGDLGTAAKNLRNAKDPERRTDILDLVDTEAITKRLMDILEIRNEEDRKVGIEHAHIEEIKQYLKALDLIVFSTSVIGEIEVKPQEHILFTQPGMRFCQAQALVHSLMKDMVFSQLDAALRAAVTESILEQVRGRMLEDIILLETSKALGKRYEVFKLQFQRGEYDMVIYDSKENNCALYEVKHSKVCVRDQTNHLRNEEFLKHTSHRFGELVGRYVLYLGEDLDTEDGIAYRNAETYLKQLPTINLAQ